MSSKDLTFFLVWLWHTRHTAWIDLRWRGAIVATERRHFAGACFHISRGDSVHATLRKPALNFCSRYEGSPPAQPSSQPDAPADPLLPGETSSFLYYPLRLPGRGHRRSR